MGSVPPSLTDKLDSGFKDVVFKLFLRQGEPGGLSALEGLEVSLPVQNPQPTGELRQDPGSASPAGIPSGVGQIPQEYPLERGPRAPPVPGWSQGVTAPSNSYLSTATLYYL